MSVPFIWTADASEEDTKPLMIRRGSYRIDVKYEVKNDSGAPWSVAPYAQIQRDMPPLKRSYFDVDSYSFTGPAYWDGGKYEKLKITKDEDARFNREFTNGWIAALQ